MNHGDPIAALPTNPSTPITQTDVALTNHLFGQADHQVNRGLISNHMKGPLLAGALAALVMLPMADEMILRWYPKAKDNIYTMIIVKMVIVAVLYYIVYNWALSRQ